MFNIFGFVKKQKSEVIPEHEEKIESISKPKLKEKPDIKAAYLNESELGASKLNSLCINVCIIYFKDFIIILFNLCTNNLYFSVAVKI